MTKLPLVTGAELARLLLRLGFAQIRQKGSHAYFHHPGGRATVIPMHKGETIGRGPLRSILREIELSPREYQKLRNT
ncbi:MAG: type II toxin-antitoxin system HicA family toxin [Elusimicrobiota bacterium]